MSNKNTPVTPETLEQALEVISSLTTTNEELEATIDGLSKELDELRASSSKSTKGKSLPSITHKNKKYTFAIPKFTFKKGDVFLTMTAEEAAKDKAVIEHLINEGSAVLVEAGE